jgi:hypothetical protein
MSNAIYAFVLNETDDWRKADSDQWNWEVYELNGSEKILGHRNIDGANFKVLRAEDGKILAVSKN